MNNSRRRHLGSFFIDMAKNVITIFVIGGLVPAAKILPVYIVSGLVAGTLLLIAGIFLVGE